MKAILEFDLYEEEWDFDIASHAIQMVQALRKLRTWMRDKMKHSDELPNLQDVWDEYHRILQDTNISRLILE